eukprot:1156433-Pelagomonas_calceolata.AAC.3
MKDAGVHHMPLKKPMPKITHTWSAMLCKLLGETFIGTREIFVYTEYGVHGQKCGMSIVKSMLGRNSRAREILKRARACNINSRNYQE